jgi:hypothetical protein
MSAAGKTTYRILKMQSSRRECAWDGTGLRSGTRQEQLATRVKVQRGRCVWNHATEEPATAQAHEGDFRIYMLDDDLKRGSQQSDDTGRPSGKSNRCNLKFEFDSLSENLQVRIRVEEALESL